MQKWEYRIEVFVADQESTMNTLGDDGWELVAVSRHIERSGLTGAQAEYPMAYFKRPATEPPSIKTLTKEDRVVKLANEIGVLCKQGGTDAHVEAQRNLISMVEELIEDTPYQFTNNIGLISVLALYIQTFVWPQQKGKARWLNPNTNHYE